MATPARTARAASKPAKKPARAAAARPTPAAGKRTRKSTTNVAIATELAPAVAIALLDKTEQEPGEQAPALSCLAAGAVQSDTDGKVRVQLMFENGTVLPVEMSQAAGAALSRGLAAELPKK